MILYHGSNVIIDKPDLMRSRINEDFGKGFYTTPIYGQAIKWCERLIKSSKEGFVSIYEFDETAYDNLKVLKFDTYSEKWLDFILNKLYWRNPIPLNVM